MTSGASLKELDPYAALVALLGIEVVQNLVNSFGEGNGDFLFVGQPSSLGSENESNFLFCIFLKELQGFHTMDHSA